MAKLHPLNKFVDSRGWSINDIYELAKKNMRSHDTVFYDRVQLPYDYQINFSILYPGIVKAWHRHKYQDDYFCVLNGMAQVGVYKAEFQKTQKFFIGEQNPALVHIKAGEWHGLTAIGNEPCGLLYLVTKEYNPRQPDEERAPFDAFVGNEFWRPENK